MNSLRIFARIFTASLVSCVSLSLWVASAAAAESQVSQSTSPGQDGSIEEIEVTGRASRLQLRSEIEFAEKRMFALFNELNDIKEFEIVCQSVMATGSRIAGRECVPTYMKRKRMDAVANFLLTDLTPPTAYEMSVQPGAVSVNTQGTPAAQQQIWDQNRSKHEEFNAKFRELASQNPELNAAALEFKEKKERLQQLEEQARNGGGKDRE